MVNNFDSIELFGKYSQVKTSIYDSLTSTAKQIEWRTPTEFPLCPVDVGQLSLDNYASNLSKGKIVSKNEYGSHLVEEYKLVKDKLYIRTHTSDGIKPYSLITVSMNDGFFYHHGTTFFNEDGSKKSFTLAIGEEWTGGDVFDEYC